jgi:hypothetical protein
MRLRCDQTHIRQFTEDTVDRFLNARVEVHRLDDVQFRMTPGECRDGSADRFKTVAETLTTMPRHQHVRSLKLSNDFFRPVAQLSGLDSASNLQQSIDHWIPGHEDGCCINAFVQQRLSVAFGRGEMPACQPRRQDAVHLFGKRRANVSRSQTCLHVPDGNVLVKRSEGRAERRCCISLHEHRVGLQPSDHGSQPVDNPRRQTGEGLPGLHQIQIDVWSDPAQLQNLIEHFAMLSGDDDLRIEVRMCIQSLNQRRHLDRFRTRPECQHDLLNRSLLWR